MAQKHTKISKHIKGPPRPLTYAQKMDNKILTQELEAGLPRMIEKNTSFWLNSQNSNNVAAYGLTK